MARFTHRYALIGILFGVCFPVVATLFELWTKSIPVNWENITDLHAENQLLWIINTAPIFLGLAAAFAGWKQDKLHRLNMAQESIIEDKTRDLQARNNQLKDEIRQKEQLTTELIIASEEAERARKAEEQFLANMSHEIRTPLNSIVGFTRRMLESNIDDEQREYLNTVKYTSNHLVAIINDILELAKIKAGQIEFEMRPVNVKHFFGSVMNTVRLIGQGKGIDMVLRVDHSMPKNFETDTVRLSQVLLHLLNNAIKFTSKGKIALEAKVVTRGQGDFIRIEVEDTGIGIPAEKCEAIFEDFKQAESSTTRQFGGTGLGLAISKRIAELMGGRIGVNSQVGEGSVFWVEVPCIECDSAIDLDEPQEESVDYSQLKAKILFAEDNEMNQLLARNVFQKWCEKIEVDYVENGKEAIEMLEKNDYDLILMDLQMPVMDGFDATEYIRTKMEGPKRDIPIVALTADVLSTERKRAFEVGMNEYVTKPFRPEDLFSKIQECVVRA